MPPRANFARSLGRGSLRSPFLPQRPAAPADLLMGLEEVSGHKTIKKTQQQKRNG